MAERSSPELSRQAGAGPGDGSSRALRGAVSGVILLGILGFGMEAIVQPILPLIVLDAGGDAAFVGLLVAAFGVPTILLRPVLGRALDTWSHAGIQRGGAVVIALAPLGYLLPLGPITLAVRAVQGLGWAGYGAATHALLGKVAPPDRRGEASGYLNATHALAILIGPAVAIALYQGFGAVAPFLLASAVGLAALLVSLRTQYPAAAARHEASGVAIGGFFERSAVVPMVLVATFQSVQSLFLIFAPVYAAANGIPIEALALYYPIYGSVILVGQLTLGRLSDRFGRRNALTGGYAVAAVGVLTVALLGGLGGLIVGACLYGVGNALVTSTLGATTIDGAQPGRIGAATATYSVGYQIGASAGGAAWGFVISVAGFPWPFVGGALILVSCIVAARALVRPATITATA